MGTIFDFASFPTLTTNRLLLRQLNHDDAQAMTRIYGTEEMLRFLNMEPVDTPEKAIGLIDWFNGNFEARQGIQWAFVLNGDLIGTGGTYAWDRENRRVDIGYHVRSDYWGQGYATEAAHAIIQWSFDNLDVHRIQADCTEGNIGSERVMLKCGFKLEGTWRESCWEHGRFVNIKQFGLLRHEYSHPD